jgi:hypothetical protein
MLVGSLSACIFFLAELRQAPLTSLTLVVFALASAFGLLRALLVYRRELRLLRALPLERADEHEFAELAKAAAVTELYITPAQRPAAFCFGLLRPRIVLTSGLLERLSAEETEAVIWHEAMHARFREPLRCLLGRLVVSAFFWVPSLSDLYQRYLLAKELAADQAATARTSRAALAGALQEVAAQPSFAGAIGLGDAAAARIDRLFDPAAQLPPLFPRMRLVLSGLGAAALALALAFPGTIALGERTQLDSMLTTMSLHGLPGMAAGLIFNLALFAGIVLSTRHLARRRSGEQARGL